MSHPHNIVLDFATRFGILGLISGAGLTVGVLRVLQKTLVNEATQVYKPLIIGCCGLFAAMVTHGMVDHSIFLVDLSFAFMLAAGLLLQIEKR